MMRLFMGLLLLGVLPLRADVDALAAVRRARELIGPALWAEVVRLDRAGPGVVHLLVFELEDRLWGYEPGVGTQSLSLYGGRIEQDKADLGPLLREIEPGYRGHTVIDPAWAPEPSGLASSRLPAGCFIESVARLRDMVARGQAPDEARLLAYYAPVATGTRGHTVLYYERGGRRFLFDPERPAAPLRLPRYLPDDALQAARVATAEAGFTVPRRALFLPLRLPGPGRPAFAVAAGDPPPDGHTAMER